MRLTPPGEAAGCQGCAVIEKVEAHDEAGFAVVLLTPDDTGCAKDGEPEPRARQNVLLELGYFIGRLGRGEVCALKRGDLEIPSDLAGVVWEAMDAAGADSRTELFPGAADDIRQTWSAGA